MPVIILPLPDILFISPQPRFMCSLLIIQNYSAGPASSVPQPVHERYGICTTSTTKTLLTNSGRRQVGAQKSFCRFKLPSSTVAVDGRPTHPSGIDSRTWTSLVPSSPLQMDACWSVQILWIRTPHQLNVCMPKSQAKIPSSRFGSRDLTPLHGSRSAQPGYFLGLLNRRQQHTQAIPGRIITGCTCIVESVTTT
jgi:hypothetical protein